MPLSKAKQAEYMREYRKRLRYNVIPNVQPEVPAKMKVVQPKFGYGTKNIPTPAWMKKDDN